MNYQTALQSPDRGGRVAAQPHSTTRLSPLCAVAAGFALALGAGAAPAHANDFPTQARVEFTLQCMDSKGGQSYDTLYACVCVIDRLAAEYTYAAYTEAQTLSYLYGTPGERGGVFRDAAPDARQRVKALKTNLDAAEAACFVPALKAPE